MYAEKLKKELAEIKGASRYVEAVKQEVYNAVMSFCGQSAEFAQAVEQSSKTFGQCCEAVVKNVSGGSLSDVEAFRRAADFYFPGAKIEFRMVIHMSEWEEPGEAPAAEENPQTSGESPDDFVERIAEEARKEAEPEKPKESKKAEIALDLFDLL